MIEITLQYFSGCPNWEETQAHIETLRSEGLDLQVDRHLIETPEAAEQHRFRGSPTILINGTDPFADPDTPIGLACRVYRTETGYRGSPSLDQVREAVRRST